MDVPNRRVAVYLEPAVIRRLDELAAEEGVSRSELLRRGALAVLEADERAADAALQASYRAASQDAALVSAAARLAARTVPDL